MDEQRLAEIAAYWEHIYNDYYMPGIAEPPDTIHDAIVHVDELLGVIRGQMETIRQLQVGFRAVNQKLRENSPSSW